jgi:peptide/nickel transport system permease protein
MSGRGINHNLRTGAALALLILVITAAGIFFLPRGYNAMNPDSRFMPPGKSHLLGTDNFGRSILYRVMAGAKYTLLTALAAVAGSAAIGSALGMFSGFSGGLLDEAVVRLLDVLSSFPGILLALLFVSLFGNSPGTLAAALLVLFIPGFTRIMRNGMLRYKDLDFVLSARVAGISCHRIIFLHIFPNLLPSLLSASVLGLSNAILAESTMSYLGLGIQPPAPSWGRMLAESQAFLFNAPWCALVPGLLIMLTVLAFHYLGEGLKERAL